MVQIKFSNDLNNEAWLPLEQLSIHTVSEAVSWPTHVQRLTRVLEVSLPPWVYDGPRPPVSEFALDVERAISAPAHGTSCVSSDDRKTLLWDVFDLVLSTSKLMRSGPSEPPRFALLSTLVKGLLRVLHPNSVALEDCVLALPLASRPVEQLIIKLDPRKSGSTLLIALSHGKDCSEVKLPVVPPSRSDAYACHDLFESYYRGFLPNDGDRCEQLVSEEDPIAWDDGVARLNRFSEYLPILCVAPPDIIHSMLASTLHQNYVCSINQPVVGFTLLSPDKAVVCAVFGWLETHPEGLLPVAHFVWAGPNASPRSDLGVFDLTDPCSSLAFAQFVLNSQPHFEELKTSSSEWSNHSSVKHDVVPLESCSEADDRIILWQQQINPEASKTPAMPGPRGKTSGPLEHPKVSDLKKEAAQSGDSVKGSPAEKALSSAKSTKKLSSSELCAKTARGLLHEWTIDNWMVERNVVLVCRHKGKDEEVNKMIDLYDQVTTCVYPEGWKEPSNRPRADVGVEESLRQLVQDLQNEERCQGDPDAVSSISDSFSYFLWTRYTASLQDKLSGRHGSTEADRRHAWDSLVSLCFQIAKFNDTAGPRFHASKEASVSLSRNCAVDDLQEWRHNNPPDEEPFNWSRQISAVQLMRDLADNIKSELTWTPRDKNVSQVKFAAYRQALSATGTAGDLEARLCARLVGKSPSEEQMLERWKKEEKDGAVCDVVVSVCIPHFLEKVSGMHRTHDRQKKIVKPFVFLQRPTREGGNKELANHELLTSDRALESEEDLSHWQNTSPLILLEALTTLGRPVKPLRNKMCPDLDLLLPILTVEYKKADPKKALTAVNKSRVYCVSATAFLASVGITDYPVFSLTVDGPIGILCMAWFSKEREMTFLMERNMMAFDITQPLGAFHFVCTMINLAHYSKELQKRFEEKIEDFHQADDRPDTPIAKAFDWTRSSQAISIIESHALRDTKDMEDVGDSRDSSVEDDESDVEDDESDMEDEDEESGGENDSRGRTSDYYRS